jgi:hypothetical protein
MAKEGFGQTLKTPRGGAPAAPETGFDPFAGMSPEQRTMILLMQSGLNYDDATSFLGGDGGYQNEDIQYLVSLGMSPQEAQAYLLNKELGGGRSGSAPAPVHWQSQVDPRTGEVVFFNPVTRAFERSGIQMGFPGIDPREEAAEEARQGANAEQLQLAGLQDNAAMTRATLQQQGILSNADMMERARQADNAARLRAFEARQQNLPAFGNIALGAAEQMRETLRSGGDYLARAFGQAGQNSPFGLVTPADQINSLLSAQEQIENEFNRQYSPQGEAQQAILPLLPQFQAPNLTQFQGYSTPESTLGGMPMAGGGGSGTAGGWGGGGAGFALSPGVNKNADRPGVKSGGLGTKPRPNVKDADKQSPKGLVGGLTPAEQIAMLSNAGPGRTGSAIRSTPRFQSDTIGPRRSSGEPNIWDKIGDLFGEMMPKPRYLNSPGYERGTAPGFTTAPMFVAGEPAPGRIGETGELLINPTEAPIAVVANKNLPRNMKVVPGYEGGTDSQGYSPEDRRRFLEQVSMQPNRQMIEDTISGGIGGRAMSGLMGQANQELGLGLTTDDFFRGMMALRAVPDGVRGWGEKLLPGFATGTKSMGKSRLSPEEQRRMVGNAGPGFSPQPIVPGGMIGPRVETDPRNMAPDQQMQWLQQYQRGPEAQELRFERGLDMMLPGPGFMGSVDDIARGAQRAGSWIGRKMNEDELIAMERRVGFESPSAWGEPMEDLANQDIQMLRNMITEAIERGEYARARNLTTQLRQNEEAFLSARGGPQNPRDQRSADWINTQREGLSRLREQGDWDQRLDDLTFHIEALVKNGVSAVDNPAAQRMARELGLTPDDIADFENQIRMSSRGMSTIYEEDDTVLELMNEFQIPQNLANEIVVEASNRGAEFETALQQVIREYEVRGMLPTRSTGTNRSGGYDDRTREIVGFQSGTIFDQGYKDDLNTATNGPDYSNNRSVFDFMTQYGIKELEDTTTGNQYGRSGNTLTRANPNANSAFSPNTSPFINRYNNSGGGGDIDLFNTDRVSQQSLIDAAWKGMPPRIRQIFSGKAPTPGNVTFGLPAGFKAPTMRMLAGLQPDEADAMRTAVNVISSGKASIDDLVNNAKQSASPLGAGFRGVNLVGGRF